METMEETENQGEESAKNGSAGGFGMAGRKQPRGHWFTTHTVAVNLAMTKERLISSGFYDLAAAYQSVHVNY